MTATLRRYAEYRFDARALGLVALFGVVIAGALLLRPEMVASGAAEPAFKGASTQKKAATGVVWAVAEAVFAGGLLVSILVWRRLPEWLQTGMMRAAKASGAVAFGVYATVTGTPLQWMLGAGALVFVLHVTDSFDVWWVVNNLLAVGLAIYLALLVGIVLGPVVLAVGFAGLTAYDHFFADRRGWMFDLAAWTVRRKLPALFIVPLSWRFDWDQLADGLAGELDVEDTKELMQFGIGMADLLLPAAFAVSLVSSGTLPVAGAVGGVLLACFRLSWKMEQGGGAGLPPLLTGALGGWGIAAVVGVVLA